ncbi:MAG: hypothetical protein MK008_03160 [Bdellovibrionales bacterium]|nr:hypothetical protein [Bdellovibrionales bacterium]
MKFLLFFFVAIFSYFQVQSSLCVLDCDWNSDVELVESNSPSPCHDQQKQSEQKPESNQCFDMSICNSGLLGSKKLSFEQQNQHETKKNDFTDKIIISMYFGFEPKTDVGDYKPLPHWNLAVLPLKHTIKTHSFLI